jgi:hypothetical protein
VAGIVNAVAQDVTRNDARIDYRFGAGCGAVHVRGQACVG